MALFNRGNDGIGKDEREQGANAARAQAPGGAIAKRAAQPLAKQAPSFTVGTLEAALLKEFPAEDAESWDRTGLLAGERAVMVSKVAVALDATVSAVRQAALAGANVLVTHHPAFLEAPTSFAPEMSAALSPGASVWAAVQHQVALMCFHTALDVSPRAAGVLPGMLSLDFKGQFLEPLASSRRKGYGQVCDVPLNDGEPETLARLAARCMAVFGRAPRVWGDFDKPVHKAATATGSAGAIGRACLRDGVGCLICGEIKYHEALELAQAGLAIVELGHDVSELPLAAVLADALARIGVAQDKIVVLDQSGNWATPEAVRL